MATAIFAQTPTPDSRDSRKLIPRSVSKIFGIKFLKEATMTEKELKDYQRLRAEGRWPAASDYRETERRRLRAEGHSKETARRKSWDAMLNKFRPRGTAVSQTIPDQDDDGEEIEIVNDGVVIRHTDDERRELVEVAQQATAWECNLTDALKWARDNLDSAVTPARAPSVLAWLLWKLGGEDISRLETLQLEDFLLRRDHLLAVVYPSTARERRLWEGFFAEFVSNK